MAPPEAVRTCVVCRTKAEKRYLRRYVWGGETPLYDELQRMNGRGGYCCHSESCIERFLSQEQKWLRIFRK